MESLWGRVPGGDRALRIKIEHSFYITHKIESDNVHAKIFFVEVLDMNIFYTYNEGI
jgi:hypothetical protein